MTTLNAGSLLPDTAGRVPACQRWPALLAMSASLPRGASAKGSRQPRELAGCRHHRRFGSSCRAMVVWCDQLHSLHRAHLFRVVFDALLGEFEAVFISSNEDKEDI